MGSFSCLLLLWRIKEGEKDERSRGRACGMLLMKEELLLWSAVVVVENERKEGRERDRRTTTTPVQKITREPGRNWS